MEPFPAGCRGIFFASHKIFDLLECFSTIEQSDIGQCDLIVERAVTERVWRSFCISILKQYYYGNFQSNHFGESIGIS
jgi:hypothetical protein